MMDGARALTGLIFQGVSAAHGATGGNVMSSQLDDVAYPGQGHRERRLRGLNILAYLPSIKANLIVNNVIGSVPADADVSARNANGKNVSVAADARHRPMSRMYLQKKTMDMYHSYSLTHSRHCSACIGQVSPSRRKRIKRPGVCSIRVSCGTALAAGFISTSSLTTQAWTREILTGMGGGAQWGMRTSE